VKWTRRADDQGEAVPALDQATDDRIDDELRDLD
jgi:hypothetical protein